MTANRQGLLVRFAPMTAADWQEPVLPGDYINHIALSRADHDHAKGLIGVRQRIEVKDLWINRPWLYADQILHHVQGNFTLQGSERKP